MDPVCQITALSSVSRPNMLPGIVHAIRSATPRHPASVPRITRRWRTPE